MFGSRVTPQTKQSKQTPRPLFGKSKPDLAINTTFTRHKGGKPRQIFPYESKTQELSFVSLAEVKALKKNKKGELQQQSQSEVQLQPSVQRQVSIQPAINDELSRSAQASLQAPALHRRIKGLRPSPLDLSQDVSPSDRAIPIGLIVPASKGRNGSGGSEATPLSGRHNGLEEAQTPTIVITPAKEDFDPALSAEDLKHASGYRPTSSVYSRYTNCATRVPIYGDVPPVPPLPFGVGRTTRGSTATVSEEHDEAGHITPQSERLTSQSYLPTPRRSKGWWNVVTSPFSAGSKSSAFFWRSPSLPEEDEDRTRILDDASSMGECNQHDGIIFTNRALDDDELRTALPPDTGVARPTVPKRSDTAPCALASGPTTVNIYQVPSHGDAAAYYDPSRHFPSMIVDTDRERELEDLKGWSPSQSVAHPENDRDLDETISQARRGLAADYYDPSKRFSTPTSTRKEADLEDEDLEGWSPSQSVAVSDRDLNTPKATEFPVTSRASSRVAGPDVSEKSLGVAAAESLDEDGPFADSKQASAADEPKDVLPLRSHVNPAPAANEPEDVLPLTSQVNPRPAAAAGSNVFSTPSEEELEYKSPPRPVQTRNDTGVTVGSCFSRLSASPVVEDAHTATFVGPHSANGELRQVELTPYRLSTPPDRGLGAATMASRSANRHKATENALCRPGMHERTASNESFGLGIQDAGDEKAPASTVMPVEQNRGFFKTAGRQVDRELEAQTPRVPWWRRFRWILVFSGACLVVLWIVLMVMFVPTKSSGGMAVEAEWLNLTGFPPMPTGISTVINPSKVSEVDGCVDSSQLWSCDAPVSEDQSSYRFEIRFRNHTVPKNETQLARRGMFTASPPVPSDNDQIFIGQYTDNVTSPYDGEQTPFYISLLNASVLTSTSSQASSLERRSDPYPYPTPANSSASSNSSAASAEGPKSIPSPHLSANGEPSSAEIYPLAIAQPLRLYNRGQENEHYGFYTYFDRTIYVSNSSSNTSRDSWLGSDLTSNVALEDATAVCTWSQSRLHIQIWTRMPAVTTLDSVVPLKGLPALNSTANNMTGPGSFPYSVTITLDRHGGEAKKKGVYCYGLNEQKVNKSLKMWIDEDRAFSGTLVNPAAIPGSNGTTMTKRHKDGYGGIDGGTGGCSCEWQNWR